MKLFGYFVLLVLVLHSGAKYQQDDDESAEEMKPTLRKFDNQNLYLKRLLWEIENSRSELKRGSSLYKRAHKKDLDRSLLHFAVVQRGLYLANARINFLRNGLQDEFSTGSMAYGDKEWFMLQHNASDVITHLRIRFHAITQNDFSDIQVLHPNASTLCYVLTGTLMSPVYAYCAPGQKY